MVTGIRIGQNDGTVRNQGDDRMKSGTRHHGLRIRSATKGDFSDIARIYSWHVGHGTASFEIDPPDAEEMLARWRALRAHGLPWLIAETAEAITGYACASPWRSRSAYRLTVENSVYVRHGYDRQGTGLVLMEALIRQCASLGYRQMIAVIGGSANRASIDFHERLGFRRVGVLESVGHKFDHWVDTVLMQRALGEGDTSSPGDA